MTLMILNGFKKGDVNLLYCFVSLLMGVFIVSLPIMWLGILYYMIKCRKVESCANRKCKFWSMCSHTSEDQRRYEIELRVRNLMYHCGLSEDDLKK